jgi:hypothetical protein
MAAAARNDTSSPLYYTCNILDASVTTPTNPERCIPQTYIENHIVGVGIAWSRVNSAYRLTTRILPGTRELG